MRGVLALLLVLSASCSPPPGRAGTADDVDVAEPEAERERTWRAFVPDGRGFAVELVGEPEEDVRDTETATARITSYQVGVSDGGLRMGVAYHDVERRAPDAGPTAGADAGPDADAGAGPDAGAAEGDAGVAADPYDRLRSAIVGTPGQSALTAFEERRLELAGHTGIEVKLRGGGRGADYELWIRGYLVEGRVYRLTVRPTGTRPPPDFHAVAQRFFESFGLSE